MFSNTNILLAGIEIDQRRTIFDTLGDEYQLVVVETAEDALSHANGHIGLVIGDLGSRQLSSLELLRTWKVDGATTPFLLLSDGKDVGAAVEAMKNGAADCIVKPIDRRELKSVVAGLVESTEGSASSECNSHQHNIEIPPGTSLEDLERAAVEQSLLQHHGNRTHAAKTLGISVRTLQRKLKAWGMPLHSFPHPPNANNNNFMFTSPVPPPHVYSMHAH